MLKHDGTRHFMFQRILEQHEAITTTLCLNGKNEMCLLPENLELIKKAVNVLQPFEIATTEMSADKYVSISKIIPIARSLQQVTLGSNPSLQLQKELVAQMQRRFGNIEGNATLAKSTLLDPRLKKLAFQNNGVVQGVQWLVQEMASLISDDDVDDVATTIPTSDVLWQAFDSKVADSLNTRKGRADAMIESRHYFEDRVLPREKDLLKWWLEHSGHYPLLCKLANKYRR